MQRRPLSSLNLFFFSLCVRSSHAINTFLRVNPCWSLTSRLNVWRVNTKQPLFERRELRERENNYLLSLMVEGLSYVRFRLRCTSPIITRQTYVQFARIVYQKPKNVAQISTAFSEYVQKKMPPIMWILWVGLSRFKLMFILFSRYLSHMCYVMIYSPSLFHSVTFCLYLHMCVTLRNLWYIRSFMQVIVLILTLTRIFS